MPELLEVEIYRAAAASVAGRTIRRVEVLDDWWVKGCPAEEFEARCSGARVETVGRHGKLLMLHTDDAVVGLRFGMTGRLVLDDEAAIDSLLYSSDRDDPAWVRLRLAFDDNRTLAVSDPRRLGGVELDPDVGLMGPDAASLTEGQLDEALGRSRAALKARMLDQSRLAGLGNLLVDEMLWRAGLSPVRSANTLRPTERLLLHEAIRATLEELGARGGSHLGDLQPARERGGRCPRDGTPLRREQVGGRTTYWCPGHQQ